MKAVFLLVFLKDTESNSVTTYKIFTCWPWGLCKICATAASVSVLAI